MYVRTLIVIKSILFIQLYINMILVIFLIIVLLIVETGIKELTKVRRKCLKL